MTRTHPSGNERAARGNNSKKNGPKAGGNYTQDACAKPDPKMVNPSKEADYKTTGEYGEPDHTQEAMEKLSQKITLLLEQVQLGTQSVQERAKNAFSKESARLFPNNWGEEKRARKLFVVLRALDDQGEAATHLALSMQFITVRFLWMMDILGKISDWCEETDDDDDSEGDGDGDDEAEDYWNGASEAC